MLKYAWLRFHFNSVNLFVLRIVVIISFMSSGSNSHGGGINGQCSFLKIPRRLPSRILKSDVHTLNNTDKAYLFRKSSAITDKQSDDAAIVLERLRSISPAVAQNFEIKSNAPEKMTMRLLNPSGDYTEVENSYIALSYCWQSKDRAPEIALANSIDQDEYLLPIAPSLFHALSAECRSAREGIWCDQICINQDDEVEKALAISAMDIVYKCARVVVVALDDIELSIEEQSFLLHYIETDRFLECRLGKDSYIKSETSSMELNPVFHGLFEKILRARWFSRVLMIL